MPEIHIPSIPIFALIAIVVIGLAIVATLTWFSWRRIVPTNFVHIVQSRTATKSYGSKQENGNVYFHIPPGLPMGRVVTVLPVNNFDLSLTGYKAYDKDRVPFELDVTAFFRIFDTNIAAQRIQDFGDLKKQLYSVVQGAVRNVLATYDIHEIMTGRSAFGTSFTDAVRNELKEWGVEPVKNLELMDLRDTDGSQAIDNIKHMKTSHIEMQSRTEVAKNKQIAKEAEIQAQQSVDMKAQDALLAVGQRTAQQTQAVGIAQEKAKQEVAVEATATMQKQMEIVSVETQRRAEIARAADVVNADAHRQVAVVQAEAAKNVAVLEAQAAKEAAVVRAEGEKTQTVLIAEGNLAEALNKAKGIEAEGLAKGAADTAVQMAPITTQIALAKEIGENNGYQTYLISLEQIKAGQAIGVANAGALEAADIKIFANAGSAQDGVQSIPGLLSTGGGLKLGSLLEGLRATETGAAVVDRVLGNDTPTTDKPPVINNNATQRPRPGANGQA